MKNNIVPKARKENLVVQELDGEVLIYDLNTNKAFCLNESSALVWQACDGNKNVSEIRNSLGKQLNSPVNDDYVWLALDQLKKENLIENKDEVVADFKGLSRREVVKKIGLGTMLALPIVASLTAPMAVHALSACMTGTSCSCTLSSTASGKTACTRSNGTITGCNNGCNNCCSVGNGGTTCSGTCSA